MKINVKYLFLLIINIFGLGVFNLFSQNIKVSVLNNNEPAPYAFIKINGNNIGIADSLGNYFFSEEIIKSNDIISAEYITLSSENVKYNKNKKEYIIKIKESLLPTVIVTAEKIYSFDEYFDLVKNNRYSYNCNKYQVDYDIDILNIKKEIKTECAGNLSVVLRRGYGTDFFRTITHSYIGDTIYVCKYVSTGILYAKDLLNEMTQISFLRNLKSKGKLLIHKYMDKDSQITCFTFIGGKKKDYQTAVYFNSITKRLIEIRGSFFNEVWSESVKIITDYDNKNKVLIEKVIQANLRNNNGLEVNAYINNIHGEYYSKKKVNRFFKDKN